jgi:molybdenum cofactor biosynthesis protein MoaC
VLITFVDDHTSSYPSSHTPRPTLTFSPNIRQSLARSPPSWQQVPDYVFAPTAMLTSKRFFSVSYRQHTSKPATSKPVLTHLSPTGNAHMVSISSKTPTTRTAVAVCSVHFSNHLSVALIRENGAKKGDVLGVARIAGIMAAKQTSNLIPLCHPIAITHVGIEVEIITEGRSANVGYAGIDRESTQQAGIEQSESCGQIDVTATVSCDGKTGVEMEALTAASMAALTVYDMCKAVDKGMRIEGLRVTRKEGGKSGTWIEGECVDE